MADRARGKKKHFFDAEDDGPERKRSRPTQDDRGTMPVIENRLQSLITRVGEKSTSSLESNLETLAAVVEADLPSYKHRIVEILADCAKEQPDKVCIYSTLLGLLNCRDFRFGGECVERIFGNLKQAFVRHDYALAKILTRFLADLVNTHVVQPAAMLSLYDSMLSVTMEQRIPQARSDVFVSVILSSLPWCGSELTERKGREFERLLDSIDRFMRKRNTEKYASCLRVWNSSSIPQDDMLDVLWGQILSLKKSHWQEKYTVRPYLAFVGKLGDGLPHTLPQSLPLPAHEEDSHYPQPEVDFRLFEDEDIPQESARPLPRSSIERHLTEGVIHSTIHQHYLNRKECAKRLIGLQFRNKVPLEYMIVEAVFSQLFHLPSPPHLPLFYSCLLVELCKLRPSSFPQVLAQATVLLYSRLDSMNITCMDRFSSWFSYHLSNFQYLWGWDDWKEVLEMEDTDPKRLFVKDMLEKVMRFSYRDHLLEILPKGFEAIIPPETIPRYKYDKEGSSPAIDTARKLVNAIRDKVQARDLEVMLNELDGTDDAPHKLDVFSQVMLQVGSQSFSHSYGAVARYGPVARAVLPSEKDIFEQLCKLRPLLKELIRTDEDRTVLLRNVGEFWANHHQLLSVLIEKLIRAGVADSKAAITFLFSPSIQTSFCSFYPWEVLEQTVKSLIMLADRLHTRLSSTKDDLRRSKEADRRNALDMATDETLDLEKQVEKLRVEVDDANENIKRLFLLLFQRFVIVIQEHMEEQKASNSTAIWVRCCLERMQQMLTGHRKHVQKYVRSLDNLIFTDDVDRRILTVYKRCKVIIACRYYFRDVQT